jgi:hypothetical protein
MNSKQSVEVSRSLNNHPKRNNSKIYNNQNEHLIAWKQKLGQSVYFQFWAYFKEGKKQETLNEVKELLRGIRRAYKEPHIVMHTDFNTTKDFPIEYIEKVLKLTAWPANKTLVTRRQQLLGNTIESTLDFILANFKIDSCDSIETIRCSDHLPLKAHCALAESPTKRRKIITIMKPKKPDKSWITDLLKVNKEWPKFSIGKADKRKMYSKKVIRPTVHTKQHFILHSNLKWEEKEIGIKELLNSNFRNYVKSMDLNRQQDCKAFYKILNSLLQYKNTLNMVKGIRKENEILRGREMNA